MKAGPVIFGVEARAGATLNWLDCVLSAMAGEAGLAPPGAVLAANRARGHNNLDPETSKPN